MKNQPFHRRLSFALTGLGIAFRSESSIRLQALAALAATVVLVIARPAPVWWAVFGLTIAVVLAAELFNTAIEHLVDHLHPELHPRIRDVKDCAAAAVLVTSIGALAVAGAFLFSLFG